MRVSAVICTKNEEETIYGIVSKTRKYVDEVIVVDGSLDKTTAERAKEAGAKVVKDRGRGKGEAIQLGIREARGEVIVFLDGDGSHDPEDIPRIIDPIKRGIAEHVTGSRFMGGSDEFYGSLERTFRFLGTQVINFLVSLRFGKRITDTQNGFRAVRKDVLKSLNLRERITTIEQEMVIKTLKKGYRLMEVPAHEYSRKFGKSKISLLRDGWRYVFSLIYYLYFDP